MTEVTDILIWNIPSVCPVAAAAGSVVYLATLSECTAYSGVGRGMNMNINRVDCWKYTVRGKPVLLAENPVPMSLRHHVTNMDCHIKLYHIWRIGFMKYARQFTPKELQSLSDSLS